MRLYISRIAAFLLLPLGLVFLNGCMMTDAVDRASSRGETFYKYRSAGLSQHQVLISYEVYRNKDHVLRCATWEQNSMYDTNRSAPIIGKLVRPLTIEKRGVKPIPIIELEGSKSNVTSPTTAILVDYEKPMATLQLISTNGVIIRQNVEVPVKGESRAAWGYVIMPVAWIGDIVTFPIQIFLVQIPNGIIPACT